MTVHMTILVLFKKIEVITSAWAMECCSRQFSRISLQTKRSLRQYHGKPQAFARQRSLPSPAALGRVTMLTFVVTQTWIAQLSWTVGLTHFLDKEHICHVSTCCFRAGHIQEILKTRTVHWHRPLPCCFDLCLGWSNHCIVCQQTCVFIGDEYSGFYKAVLYCHLSHFMPCCEHNQHGHAEANFHQLCTRHWSGGGGHKELI